MPLVRVIREDGAIVSGKVQVARNITDRALGLLITPKLEKDEGLWLVPCNGIHTFGMTYALDVIMLDDARRITRMEASLKPYRVLWKPGLDVASVLELPEGTLLSLDLQIGDRLIFEELDETPSPTEPFEPGPPIMVIQPDGPKAPGSGQEPGR
jgi:uncharacterized membrane protein (UPF0127 family)